MKSNLHGDLSKNNFYLYKTLFKQNEGNKRNHSKLKESDDIPLQWKNNF